MENVVVYPVNVFNEINVLKSHSDHICATAVSCNPRLPISVLNHDELPNDTNENIWHETSAMFCRASR